VRAAVLQEHGRAPEINELPDPKAGDDEALIAVTTAPITPLDILCASGSSYFGKPAVPYVPGVQGVGVLAEDCAAGAAGTRVWFPTTAGMRPGNGSMAEYCVAPAHEVVALPDGVDDVQVAALGLSAVAAWMALTWRAGMRPGEQVLVLGGGGTVGQVAVQAARILGARRVVAACRSKEAQQVVREAGADAMVPILDGDDWPTLAYRMFVMSEGEGYDVVIDPLGGVPATAAAWVLASHGRLVNLGSAAGSTASFESERLRSRSAAILGYTNNDLSNEQRRSALLEVLGHAAAGRIRVQHETVPLDELPAAWTRQAAGAAKRRIVVRL